MTVAPSHPARIGVLGRVIVALLAAILLAPLPAAAKTLRFASTFDRRRGGAGERDGGGAGEGAGG
jgi:hypothetical protein